MTLSPVLAAPVRPPLHSPAPPPVGKTAVVHLVGICGSGMKALAELGAGLGWRITGSDGQPSEAVLASMRRRGLHVHTGHHGGHLPPDADLLVYSPAVPPRNPERQSADRLGIPQLSYSEMLGRLMQERVGLSIAGTHGKSTTTAMAAFLLEAGGLRPTAAFGAELCGTGVSGWAGDGDLFVVESCEYQRSFLDLRPRYAVILGIEPDHFDCYGTFEEVRAAFADFAAQVSGDGVLLVRGDCPASVEAARRAAAEVYTFSLAPGADWWAADVRRTRCGVRFRAFHHGHYFCEVSLPLAGGHNVLNALAAAAVCHYAGASAAEIREGLREFPGIRRRFEWAGSWRGVTLIDDYAHHPTAVRATLETAREQFGRRRLWCIFQPHQVSRTRALLDEFAASFLGAAEVLIAPVYAARETAGPEAEAAARALVRRAADRGAAARFCPSLDRILATVEDEARPGDVLITMGAGDVNRVHHELTRRLPRDHAARRAAGAAHVAEGRRPCSVLSRTP